MGRPGVCLTPIARIMDGVWLNAELLAEPFHEHLHPFDLTICRRSGFFVCNDADANGPAAAVPGVVGNGRPLFLPYFRGLDFTVAAAVAVAQAKMAIEIVGIVQSVESGQLLDVAAFSAAAVNLDAVPSVRRLRGSRRDGVLDRIEILVGQERERSGGRGIMAQGHEDDSPDCH